MTIHLRIARAVFTAEGQPDTEVRVLPDPMGGFSFSIKFSETESFTSNWIAPEHTLQLAESLQFVSDTVGASVPGRLSPFVRGWISNAADIHYKCTEEDLPAPNVDDETAMLQLSGKIQYKLNDPEQSISRVLAEVVADIMAFSHERGWDVAQQVEELIKNAPKS